MTVIIKVKGFVFFPEYFSKMLGCIHKWIGQNNDEHGNVSLYSYSHIWDNKFYFSCYDESIVRKIEKGIFTDPKMWNGVSVISIEKMETNNTLTFRTASPIFAKIHNMHVFDTDAEIVCANILAEKARIANIQLPQHFKITLLDKKNKLIKIHNISNRCAHYTVKFSSAEVANFAMCVGLGNCTGVGFGCIIPFK